jgi:hypothetical protein
VSVLSNRVLGSHWVQGRVKFKFRVSDLGARALYPALTRSVAIRVRSAVGFFFDGASTWCCGISCRGRQCVVRCNGNPNDGPIPATMNSVRTASGITGRFWQWMQTDEGRPGKITVLRKGKGLKHCPFCCRDPHRFLRDWKKGKWDENGDLEDSFSPRSLYDSFFKTLFFLNRVEML